MHLGEEACRNSKKKRRDIQRRTRGSAFLPAPAKSSRH